MKKFIVSIVILCVALVLVACGEGSKKLNDHEFEREEVTLSVQITAGAVANTNGNG